MLKSLKNLCFPGENLCLLCRDKNRGQVKYICPDCYDQLDIVNKEVFINSPYINKAYYSLFYNRFMRSKIRDFKYYGKSYLYKPFGELMVETVTSYGLEKDTDLILYVPSHRRKEAIRGYNQAELLADYLSRETGIPLIRNNLIKIRRTKEQSHSKRLERLSNLNDSFYIKDPTSIEGKSILLIDDIITTGTTLIECSRLIKEEGGGRVVGLTLTSSKS